MLNYFLFVILQVEIAQERLKKWYMGEKRRPQASMENA
jgi:NOL1/NOP2/fmu family ribosome biogenesis protein